MTTVVVVKKNGRAAIAADTMTVFGGTKVTSKYRSKRQKVLKVGKTFIALAGSCAHNNVFASLLGRHHKQLSFQDPARIFESYLHLHRILKEEYFLNPREGDDDPYESSQVDALVANQYGIFGMYSWREVFEYDRFWALGSGSSFALGAMYTVYDKLATAEQIAEAGILAGCEFDSSTGLPFTLETIPLVGSKRKTVRVVEPAPATARRSPLVLSK